MIKIIYRPIKILDDVLGKSVYESNVQYRYSSYLHLVGKPYYLLYNTFTKALIKVDKHLYEKIENTSLALNDEIEILVNNRILVPINVDEEKIYNQLRLVIKPIYMSQPINNFDILTTTNCNARCFYCYETGSKKIDMSIDVAIKAANYMLEKSKNQCINITWFGGEPLCNIPVIDQISGQLNKENKNWKSIMISNGYLFDNELCRRAKDQWHLNFVQITLDGTKDIYNKTKNYITHDINPFEKVLHNIAELAKNKINVSIRLNLGKHNSEDIFNLVDIIAERFKYNPFISIYARLLYENSGLHNKMRTEKEHQIMSDTLISLLKYIDIKGMLHAKKLSKDFEWGACMANNYTSLLISPEGNLGKCEHYFDKHLVGTIYDNSFDVQEIEYFQILRNTYKDCENCILKPMCNVPMNCPGYSGRACDIYERREKLFMLEKSMIATYKALEMADGH